MSDKIEIQQVMTPFPHSIGLDQEIKKAAAMMHDLNVRHLPVQEGGKLVGVISDRDIKYASDWNELKPGALKIEDVYTPNPYVVEPSADLRQVLIHMVKEQIGCTLVANNGNKLLGIFTTTDACKYLAYLLEES